MRETEYMDPAILPPDQSILVTTRMAPSEEYAAAPQPTDAGIPRQRSIAGRGEGDRREYEAIVTTSLADEIAFRLQAAIIDGVYPPGAHLRQEEICQRFNVSRTPVREALRKLQAKNFVLMTPNKGATVRFPDRRDLREIYAMRAELEGFACALAAEAGMTAAVLADLEAAQLRVRTATAELEQRPMNTEHGYYFLPLIRANDQFHKVIHRHAGNDRLSTTLSELQESFPKDLVWRAMRSLTENRGMVIDEHEAVMQALRTRDAGGAREAMSSHVLHAGSVLMSYLDEHGFWEQ